MGLLPSTQPSRSKRGRPADEWRRQDKDRGLYHCDYCHKDLSNVPRIKCAVCPDFDLCLECFSVGAQIWPHSNGHAYRVVDNLSFPLYHPEWGADEELLLLEAIDMYGLGNWGPDPLHRNSVADHVGMKSGPECRQHYYSVYVDTDCFPDPKPAPEMGHVDIAKLIEAHRSSGQQRMTTQRGAAPPPAKKAHLGPGQAAVLAGEGATPGMLKEEPGLVKEEPGSAAGAAVPMDVGGGAGGAEVKTEDGAAAEAGPSARHEQGDKGRLHAAAAVAKHHAEEAAATAAEADGVGAAAAAGGAEPPDEPHHSTANFGLRLRAASVGQELSNVTGATGAAAGGGGFATHAPPGFAPPAGPGGGGAAAGKSPAEGSGAGALGAGAIIGTSDAQQTGYHVKRNEFEPEYDNDAESIVAELEFGPEDTLEQVAQKLHLVEVYNRRLDERERRKAFVLDRGLLNVRKQQAADRKRSAAERELQARLRVFARYLPQEQFEALAEGMAVEARLRARVAELAEYRRLGLRTFEEVDEMEAVLDAAGRKKAEAADKPPPTSKSKPARVLLDEAALQSELLRLGLPHAAAQLDALRTMLAEGKTTSAALQAWRSKRGALLDITSLPDAEPLTQKERALCASERYLPAQYLAVKAELLKLQEAQGQVSRADVVKKLHFKVDPARLLRLLDFMTQQGWVRQPAAAGQQH